MSKKKKSKLPIGSVLKRGDGASHRNGAAPLERPAPGHQEVGPDAR
jgi:hypothetical protein